MNGESIDLIYLDTPFSSKHNYATPIAKSPEELAEIVAEKAQEAAEEAERAKKNEDIDKEYAFFSGIFAEQKAKAQTAGQANGSSSMPT